MMKSLPLFHHTYLDKKTFQFKWTIDEFPLIFDICERHKLSTNFNLYYKSFNNSICLELSKILLNGSYHLYLNLQFTRIGCKLLYAPIEITIIDSKGNKLENFKECFDNYKNNTKIDIISIPELLKTKEILPDYNLTILMEITMIGFYTVQSPENTKLEVTDDSKLNKDFIKIYENKLHADVTLVAEGQEFLGHKCILASRSEVFAAMFQHEMKENQTNIVNIPNIKGDTLNEILSYIYTGKVPKIDKITADLYAASDQYDLKHLKKMCEVVMIQNISVENAVESLLKADQYNLKSLKDEAISYIKKNAAGVFKTEGWKYVVENHPHLITE